MNIKPGELKPEPFSITLWQEFQEGLSAILDIPIALYDGNGRLISPSSKTSCLCDTVGSHDLGRQNCEDAYSKAVKQVLEKGKTYIYKCHANQYLFAVPVFVSSDRSYVIIGGRAYLSGNEAREFYEGTAAYGLDEGTISRLRQDIRVIPPKTIFALPSIVNRLAVPFIKSLHEVRAKALPEGEADKSRLKPLHALEQVYVSIAPVLDREELYAAILVKSSELVDAERGSLMILDNKNNLLSIKASKGMDRQIADGLKVKMGEGISGAIAARGLPVMIGDIESELPRKNRARYRTKSFVSIPLKLENKVIGVINLSDKMTGEIFSEDDLQLLMSFASYASIALERGAYYSMTEELKLLSMTDPLTGLFNRRYFRERICEEVERVKRHGGCFTVFMTDLDNFKWFNDRYGHAAGDDILKGVARSIRDAVRSMDVVARYGGEEFAVILPHTDKKDSFVIAERIRKGVESFKPEALEGEGCPTISLGAAEFPGDANNIDELMTKADRAMYVAKRMGKNRVVIYEK